ncbi:MAG TPA: hypothetical protein PKD83_08710 [Ignavibacteria bacterium]|nr:hypothetical protein [Ignavibacteria bacterium]
MKNYLKRFEKISRKIKSKLPSDSQLEITTGIWLDSVVLKIQKNSWKNITGISEKTESSIFFSIWLEEKGIKKNQIFYNIHAFKLRKLLGYKIESRDFAFSFRQRFKKFNQSWPNVSENFGPLTLMQGWLTVDLNNFENDVLKLTDNFMKIIIVIDDLLEERKTEH